MVKAKLVVFGLFQTEGETLQTRFLEMVVLVCCISRFTPLIVFSACMSVCVCARARAHARARVMIDVWIDSQQLTEPLHQFGVFFSDTS